MQKSSFLVDNNSNVVLLLRECTLVVHLWSFKFAVSDALFCLLKITEFIGRSSYELCSYHDTTWICNVPNIIPNRSFRTNYYFCFLIRREIRNLQFNQFFSPNILAGIQTGPTGASANHVDRKTSIKFIF